MGQIIIELPTRINRRFRLKDKKTADEILKSLEAKGEIIDVSEKLSKEDLEDIRDARKALKEYEKNGESYTVEQLRAEFGL